MDINFFLADIEFAAATIIREFEGKYSVILFDAEMGSGKTTLIREICRQLGVEENVSSPTFSIINEYRSGEGKKIYHLDLYRIRDDEEAIATGVEDCLYSGELCFVEWPGKAPAVIPPNAGLITINVSPSGERNLSLTAAAH